MRRLRGIDASAGSAHAAGVGVPAVVAAAPVGFVVVPAAALAALLAAFAIARAARAGPAVQSVAIDLRVDYAGAVALHAFSLGAPYSINPDLLKFSGHPYASKHGVERRVGRSVVLGVVRYCGMR